MKIPLPFDFDENFRNFMRRAGYSAFSDPNTGKTSYTKRLDREYYPRFHAYIQPNSDNRQLIDLHLDQKKPSYPGSSAHNAEYEGGRVEQEGRRLEGLIKNQMDNQGQGQKSDSGERSFWSKLFKS